MLDFGIDLADVHACDAQGDEDEASDNPDGEDERRPAWDGGARNQGVDDVKADAEGDDEEHPTKGEDDLHGARAERGDAIDSEVEHLLEGVFRDACLALADGIIDGGGGKAYHGDESAQIDIALVVTCKHVEGALAHQTEVGMIIDALDAHRLLKLVEGLGRHALHEGIGGAGDLDTIDDVVALGKVAHHLGDALDIILKVGIDGDDGIGPLTGGHHASHDGVLVAHVAGEVDPLHVFIGGVQLTDNLPRTVATAIVDEDHHGIGADKAIGDHALEEGREALCGVAKHIFFVITGGYGC